MRLLSASGVMTLRWRRLPPRLYVFTYHRVGNRGDCGYNRNLFSCTAGQFRDHVALFKDRFDIVNVDRLASFAEHGYSGRRPLALITFDDGYLDNYLLAYPVLRDMGVPAVFFVPTDFVGSQRLLWNDEIAWMLRNTRRPTIRVPAAVTEFSLADGQRETSIREILRHVRGCPVPIAEQVDRIREACGGASPPAEGDRPRFMDWTQLREMSAGGMDIGSHTRSHTPLARLSPDRQREELAGSRAALESELRTPVRSVAYPVGDGSAYTAQSCEIARDVGYRLGFNFVRRTNRFPLANPWDIGRLAVDSDITAFGVKSRACFPAVYAN